MPVKEGEIHILVALTGSVASIKVPILVPELLKLEIPNHKVSVEVMTTQHAEHFFNLPQQYKVWRDSDEWTQWKKIGDPVVHIELRRWADILIIAPIDANTMAKASHGICDNLVTSTIRAWDMDRPLLFAPAMNTHMYEHPLTAIQIKSLKEMGYIEIPSISKKLACGDTGMGAMASVDTIVQMAKDQIISRVVGKTWRSYHT